MEFVFLHVISLRLNITVGFLPFHTPSKTCQMSNLLGSLPHTLSVLSIKIQAYLFLNPY